MTATSSAHTARKLWVSEGGSEKPTTAARVRGDRDVTVLTIWRLAGQD